MMPRLAAHRAFVTDDLDQFRRYMSGSYCDHGLHRRGGAGAIAAAHHRAALSSMSLNYLTYGADVEIDIGTFDTFYMVEVPLAGTVGLRCGGREITTSPEVAAVISPTLPVRSRWSASCAQLMVKIPRTTLERHAAQLLGRPLSRPLEFEPRLELASDAGRALSRLMLFMADQIEDGVTLFGRAPVSRELEELFLTTLLTGQPHSHAEALDARTSAAAPRHVRRALDHIRANLTDDIMMADLVAQSGVGARTLYAGFERFVGMPPAALIKSLRLDGARDDLIAGNGATVADIATRWNFLHLGRFSGDYRRRFGERPVDTFRR